MSDSEFDRDPIEKLADSFVRRLRAGEYPSLSEFVARFPDLKDAIEELLPALVELERNDLFDAADNRSTNTNRSVTPPRKLGEYLLVREIGRGGMGVVYEAFQETLGRHVALKVLSLGALRGSTLDRFRLEARAAAQLHHTNIVPVFGVGEHQGIYYFTMQFIPGQSLDLVIDELRRIRQPNPDAKPLPSAFRSDCRAISAALLTGQFPDQHMHGDSEPGETSRGDSDIRSAIGSPRIAPNVSSAELRRSVANSAGFTDANSGDAFYQSVARIGVQVAEALSYAHSQGVLHRDIKPSNLLLDARGTAWVTDFGLAKIGQSDVLTHAGEIVGTLRYMAPERIDGLSDQRGDVYGLGATLYELLALHPLHEASSRAKLIETIIHTPPTPLRRIDSHVPRDLDTIVGKALAKDPVCRYQTAVELADDLRRFLEERPVLAHRTHWPERCWRWCRRNPALASVTAAMVLAFVLGFAGVTWKWRDAEQARRDEHQAREDANRSAEETRQRRERLIAAGKLVDEGTQLVGGRGWDDVEAAFSEAINLCPELAAAWEKRGDVYFQLGLFEMAGEDYQRAFELQPPVFPPHWVRHALLRLRAGDREGYEDVCDRMRTDIGGTAVTQYAIDLVRTCVLSDKPHGDTSQWVRLAEQVVACEAKERFRHVLATAYYRAGEYDRAILQCREASDTNPDWSSREMTYPILAMAYYRLGQKDNALRTLQLASAAREKWIEQLYLKRTETWSVDQGATAQWPVNQLDWLEFDLLDREARTLLGLPMPPDDARLRVMRGRAWAGLRRRVKAVEEYQAAFEMGLNDPLVHLEAHRIRGTYLSQLGKHAQAVTEFAQALNLAPEDGYLWQALATTQLAASDVAAYRESCTAMVNRFGTSSDRLAALRVVRVCTLQADALDDMARLLPIAETAASYSLDARSALMAVHYRVDQFEDALRCLQERSEYAWLRPSDLLFAAMAHQRLGQFDSARQRLEKAIAIMNAPAKSSSRRSQALGMDTRDWTDLIAERLLRQEAEALILGTP